MIGDALEFLNERLYQHLLLRNNDLDPLMKNDNLDRNIVSFMTFTDDQSVEFKKGQITPLLVNVEEEKILCPPNVAHRTNDGRIIRMNPDIRLILNVLFVSKFGTYRNSMDYLAEVISFFQSNKVFEQQQTRKAGFPQVKKLVVELVTLPFSQQNEVWNALRSAYLPSVFYKISMVVFRDQRPGELTPITHASANINHLSSGPEITPSGLIIRNIRAAIDPVKPLISQLTSQLEFYNQLNSDEIKANSLDYEKKKDAMSQCRQFVNEIQEKMLCCGRELDAISQKFLFFTRENQPFVQIINGNMNLEEIIQSISAGLKNDPASTARTDKLGDFNDIFWEKSIIDIQEVITFREPQFKAAFSLGRVKSQLIIISDWMGHLDDLKNRIIDARGDVADDWLRTSRAIDTAEKQMAESAKKLQLLLPGKTIETSDFLPIGLPQNTPFSESSWQKIVGIKVQQGDVNENELIDKLGDVGLKEAVQCFIESVPEEYIHKRFINLEKEHISQKVKT